MICELYFQRKHNQNSVKPLGQIIFIDTRDLISVRVLNAGMGPLIIDNLIFAKHEKHNTDIAKCLSLNPRSYMHADVDDIVKKVLLPNAEMIVFEKNISASTDEEIRMVRAELAEIRIKTYYRDVYNNRFSVERSLSWFTRYEKVG